jgi:Protein of unknown function (DUF1479)
MYIPVCPVTEANAKYMAKQRDAFLKGIPAPDFPGGEGESKHIGRPTLESLQEVSVSVLARQAAGIEKITSENGPVIDKANKILGF